MAIEFDTQPPQRQDYHVSVFDLVSRTFGLWFKNIAEYLVLFTMATVGLMLLSVAVLISFSAR